MLCQGHNRHYQSDLDTGNLIPCMTCSPMARRALNLHKPNASDDSQSCSPTPAYLVQQALAQQPTAQMESQAPRVQSLAAASSFAASAAASAAVATEAAALTRQEAALQSGMQQQQQQQQCQIQQGTVRQQVSVHTTMVKFCCISCCCNRSSSYVWTRGAAVQSGKQQQRQPLPQQGPVRQLVSAYAWSTYTHTHRLSPDITQARPGSECSM